MDFILNIPCTWGPQYSATNLVLHIKVEADDQTEANAKLLAMFDTSNGGTVYFDTDAG